VSGLKILRLLAGAMWDLDGVAILTSFDECRCRGTSNVRSGFLLISTAYGRCGGVTKGYRIFNEIRCLPMVLTSFDEFCMGLDYEKLLKSV
jgi:hypothetical protein